MSYSDLAEGDAHVGILSGPHTSLPTQIPVLSLSHHLAGTEDTPEIRSGVGVQLCVPDSLWMEVLCVNRSPWEGVSFLEQNWGLERGLVPKGWPGTHSLPFSPSRRA